MSQVKSVVLLSGGMDSAYSLLEARELSEVQECIFFNYGQRNVAIERRLSSAMASGYDFPFKEIHLPLRQLATSGVTEDLEGTQHPQNSSLLKYFVPGRNDLFLTYGAIRAYTLGATAIFSGICSTSPNAYPDCTEMFTLAKQNTLRLALGYPSLALYSPAMHLERWQVFQQTFLLAGAQGLNLLRWHTTTGYGISEALDWVKAFKIDRAKQWDWGYGPDVDPEDLDPALWARREAWFKFTNWLEENEITGVDYGRNPA